MAELKGLIGLMLIFFGVLTLASSFIGVAFWTYMNGIGIPIDLSFIWFSNIISAIIGILALWFGFKWFFEAESRLFKVLLGFIGVLLFLIGMFFAFATPVTAGVSLLGTILIWSMALAFISYGFDIEVLKFAKRIIDIFKRLTK